jgi:hypothetical protein
MQNYFSREKGYSNNNYYTGSILKRFDINLYTLVQLHNLKLDYIRNNKHVYFLDLLKPLKL